MSKNGTAIAILGSKGGVGTTTIASNLAELNNTPNRSVLLVDLNYFSAMSACMLVWNESQQ